MARPLSVTDQEILDATERVASRLGAHGITISEVAREVGLSRAAITLRFQGVEELKWLLMERLANRFEERLAAEHFDDGAHGLVKIAGWLGAMLGGRKSFAGFWVRYSSNLDDPVLNEMEQRRGRALRSVITRVMPRTAIDESAAVDSFMAQMTGSMMHWLSSNHADASRFLQQRALDWVRLAGIAVTPSLIAETSRA